MYKHLLYIQHKHQEHHEKVNVKHIVITIDIKGNRNLVK